MAEEKRQPMFIPVGIVCVREAALTKPSAAKRGPTR
jgi:hypothetical protein